MIGVSGNNRAMWTFAGLEGSWLLCHFQDTRVLASSLFCWLWTEVGQLVSIHFTCRSINLKHLRPLQTRGRTVLCIPQPAWEPMSSLLRAAVVSSTSAASSWVSLGQILVFVSLSSAVHCVLMLGVPKGFWLSCCHALDTGTAGAWLWFCTDAGVLECCSSLGNWKL